MERAIAALPGRDLSLRLQEVVACLPTELSVETASVRLCDTAGEVMHLLAAVGMPSLDVRKFGLEQLTVSQARSLLAVGTEHTLARALGLSWLDGEWLTRSGEVVGTVLVGSRTSRRPSEGERALLTEVAERIAERLDGVDRSPRTLRQQSLAFIRRLACVSPTKDDGALAKLRPRERTILELYVDGLGPREIAELLVISPHTVRTHLKLAYRRLGVHSRDEAERFVRKDQLLMLL
ncbi:MAG: response regulator transcription factor [Gaiellaceae bacterium]